MVVKVKKLSVAFFMSCLLLIGGGILFAGSKLIQAHGDANNMTEYVDCADIVDATYIFTRLNDTDCSIRIANKAEATRAVLPAYGDIDGIAYRVTTVAVNGFMSSPKLKRVTLSNTIEKIDNMSFANCLELEKVFLSNVHTIGNGAFTKCLKLESIVLPKSITTIGTAIFRNCNVQVYARAECNGSDWVSSWNAYNENQTVVYGSDYRESIVLDPLYNVSTRGIDAEIVGYAIASGQPFTENYYETEDLYINAVAADGNPILMIEEYAYAWNVFDKCIIEYSENPLSIETCAFFGAEMQTMVEL